MGKLFRERYRLNRFGRGGFVRLARKAGVPIIPVAIVGAEEIHPVLGKITSLAEPLGLPYIPITPTFPWLGPLGLLPVPTKWTIRFGEPIAAGRGRRRRRRRGRRAGTRRRGVRLGIDAHDLRPAGAAPLDSFWVNAVIDLGANIASEPKVC